MNPWPFIGAAYAVTLTAIVGLALASYLAMHRGERPGSGDGGR